MEGVRPYPLELVSEYNHRGWLGINIVDAFEVTCDIHPEREAVVEGDERLTYAELRERSYKAALAFSRLGLERQTCVLLQVPNWIEAVVIYLGLQIIGVIPVLCLPRHGQRELERFATLTGARAWIGPARFGNIEYLPMVGALTESCPHLEEVIVVRDEAPAGTQSFSQLVAGCQLEEATYDLLSHRRSSPDDVIHFAPTGGTTGVSKLVPKTHNAHLCKSYFFARTIGRSPWDVDLVVAPINHDAPQMMYVGPQALFGGKLVLCSSTRAKDILEYIEKERVTFCFLVPTLLADVLHEPDMEKYDCSSLRAIITGGAHCAPELVQEAYNKLPSHFYNCYGMTEGAGFLTRVDDPFEVTAHTVGKKFCPYDKYKVVDEDDDELPQGQEGELVAKGPSIVSGYYKSEGEERLVFTRDAFFRTGDIGKFDQLGNLIITGRKKDIINRGGEKISAQEVEDLIANHPRVLRAAVVGMPDPRLGERVCAYVEPMFGQKVTSEDIISHVKDRSRSLLLLPERVEIVPEIPLTAMNKVNKQQLREDIAQKLKAEGKL